MYVDGLVGPEHGQHDADGDAAGRARAARGIEAPDGRPGPDGRPRRRSPQAGIDMDDVTDKLLRDGIDRVRDADGEAAGGHRVQARGDRHARRPQTIDSRDPRRATSTAIAARVRQAGRRATSPAASGARTTRCGARRASPRSPTASAGSTSPSSMLEEADDLDRVRARGRAPTACADAVLLGMGGSSLAPEVFAPLLRAARGRARLHVLDSTDADAVRDVRGRASTSSARCSSSRRSRAARSRRCRRFEHFWEATGGDGRASSRSPTPGSLAGGPRARAGLPPRLHQRPRHRRALQRAVATSGSCPAALMGADVRGAARAARRSRRAGVRAARLDAANSGLWLGLRARRARAARPRQAHVRRRRRRSRAFGLWVEQLVAESTGKHGKGILPVADEPLGAPEVYGDDRVFVHLRNEDRPTTSSTTRVARAGRRRPAR